MRPARAFALCSTLIGSLALPAVASASTSAVPVVTITAPADGALVAGIVEVVATTDGTVVSVAFDWSDDGGASWQPASTGLKVPWRNHMVERLTQVDDEVFAVLSNGEVLVSALNKWNWQRAFPEIKNAHAVGAM